MKDGLVNLARSGRQMNSEILWPTSAWNRRRVQEDLAWGPGWAVGSERGETKIYHPEANCIAVGSVVKQKRLVVAEGHRRLFAISALESATTGELQELGDEVSYWKVAAEPFFFTPSGSAAVSSADSEESGDWSGVGVGVGVGVVRLEGTVYELRSRDDGSRE